MTTAYSDGEKSLNMKTFLSAGIGRQTYPQENSLYNDHTDTNWAADFRVLLNGALDQRSHFEINIHQHLRSLAPLQKQSNTTSRGGRSNLFTWEQHSSSNSLAELSLDSAYLQHQHRHLDLTIGRQPINLATTFYFTPNDFFEPFAAQAFFRTYKPGMDALRAEIKLSNLSQLTILTVLSYDSDETGEWSKSPNWPETSLLARITGSLDLFELSLLSGTVKEYTVIGGSIQGELLNWLGIRAEGHYAEPQTKPQQNSCQIAAGIEHYHDNGIFWRLEYLFNKNGFSSTPETVQTIPEGLSEGRYLGRDSAALGISYEFTPLLTGNALAMANLNDHSRLLSLDFVYSLSDESEVGATITFPEGDKPDMDSLGSEFGRQPSSVSCVYRLYF